MKKRIKRTFPCYIYLTPGFCWSLGFYKGEGLNSIKSKTYYRFGISNKNPVYINKFMDEMISSKLLAKHQIRGKCFQIHHFAYDLEDVKKYWSNKLDFPLELFSARDYNHNLTKEGNGVCHFDISEVLLRRILDLINDEVLAEGGISEQLLFF